MFLTSVIRLIFSYHEVLKFRSNQTFNCTFEASSKEPCWLFKPEVVCTHYCSTVIGRLCVAGNMNSKKPKFRKFRKKHIRDILFYRFIPHVINCDIFITLVNYLFLLLISEFETNLECGLIRLSIFVKDFHFLDFRFNEIEI